MIKMLSADRKIYFFQISAARMAVCAVIFVFLEENWGLYGNIIDDIIEFWIERPFLSRLYCIYQKGDASLLVGEEYITSLCLDLN